MPEVTETNNAIMRYTKSLTLSPPVASAKQLARISRQIRRFPMRNPYFSVVEYLPNRMRPASAKSSPISEIRLTQRSQFSSSNPYPALVSGHVLPNASRHLVGSFLLEPMSL